ncbi:OmpW/AlkL family protein [Marinibactrum halimedae]|uniref:Outer membrane protein OmpW n=1 Tax=Marinibactrum halimedae TaxID=1444977 RepID=A0AA37T6L0_9GAMM|nr:OmpW family outer membrane protein [Marinibactrum halimedae]MCD9459590.1 outer membrane beta-barrel protein [Marinibactrum halimedae]GLS25592.1 outer membrane protein OmpW [Marinibactrum halimedae]
MPSYTNRHITSYILNLLRKVSPAIGLAAILYPSIAWSDSDQWQLRFGAATVAPSSDSDILSLDVEDDTQLGLSVVYKFSQHFGVELLLATPFKHQIDSEDLGITIGETQHLPPTLSAQYYFDLKNDAIQPYIGLGLNYTTFFEEDTTSEFEAIAGDSDLSLDDSFGLTAQLGVDIRLNHHWKLNAAVWQMDIDSSATAETANLGNVNIDVEIDPIVYMIGASYTF